MKLLRSENNTPMSDMVLFKLNIHLSGQYEERIWAFLDDQEGKMYLCNDALVFRPFPSYGMELPYQKESDVKGLMEKDITFHPEAYDKLLKLGVIKDNDTFDIDFWNLLLTLGKARLG